MGNRWNAIKITTIYFILGSIWIVSSDKVLATLLVGTNLLPIAQTVKGWFYVLGTAMLLYVLIQRSHTKMMKTYEKLQTNTEKIKLMASYDSLTGLPNRAKAVDTLNELRRQPEREMKLAILYINMDRFRNINNTFGHAFGDRVLKEISHRIQKNISDLSNLARVSGDEYLFFFEFRDFETVTYLSQQLLEEFEHPMEIGEYEFRVTASIGIAVYDNTETDAEDMIQAAKLAMYRAKDLGKNNYQLFTKEMNTESFEKIQLENELRKALANNELTVHFQPQVSVLSNNLIGLEALMRWEHHTKGNIPPGQFIPIAEESGLIVPMGEWIFETVCHQLKQWELKGYPIVPVSINLSMRQFLDSNLTRKLSKILTETGTDASQIDIEITESMTMDVDFTILRMSELKQMGFKLSIDDFGTGYSSLNYLRLFPVDRLKIDQSFVRDLANANSAKIVSTIIAMAHNLDLSVIAEGVETKEQLSFLRAHKCDEIQGYYISKPLPVNKLEHLLIEEVSNYA